MTPSLAFGPIASRRLGSSLGINNIPPKHCTYDCVYCQVGRTLEPERVPRPFYEPAAIAEAVDRQLQAMRARGHGVQFLTLAPDGEPTLDARLGEVIDWLRPFGVPIAVFTNASLLPLPSVRAALARADWVSLKVDAVGPDAWRRVNRPHPDLDAGAIQDAMRVFAAQFAGTLATETLLVEGINDDPRQVDATAAFVGGLAPSVAYLGVPTRPPAESWARPPVESTIVAAYEVFAAHVGRVELLCGDALGVAGATGDLEADLLGITAVHPLREEEVARLIADNGGDPSLVARLVARGALRRVPHRGVTFYVRAYSLGSRKLAFRRRPADHS